MSIMNKEDLEAFRDYKCTVDNVCDVMATVTVYADGGHLVEGCNPIVVETAKAMAARMSLDVDMAIRKAIEEMEDV